MATKTQSRQKYARKPLKQPEEGGFATIPALAAYLDISRSKVYRMMEEGSLAFVKLGKSRRVPWSAVQSLVEQNTVGA